MLLCATLVFFMQAGFALLEAGTVRCKNVRNIIMKNGEGRIVGAGHCPPACGAPLPLICPRRPPPLPQ